MAKRPTYEELEQKVKELEIAEAECEQSEVALQESEERFRLLSEASFEGVGIAEKGMILDANEQFAKMLGYTCSEVIGMEVMDLVVPESRELVQRYWLLPIRLRDTHHSLHRS